MRFSTKKSVVMLFWGVMLSNNVGAAESLTEVEIEADKPLFSILVNKHSRSQLITSNAVWAEGPLCLPDGSVLFSDVKQNKVMIWSEKQGLKEWLSPSDFQNCHALDLQGRVIAASHGKRALLRQNKDGSWEILADAWQGKPLNSPNDVTIAPDGAIWFTDPTFGVLNKKESYGGTPEQGGEFIYRYDTVSKTLSRLNAPETHSPNGLAFSADGKRLYVADSEQAHDFNNTALAEHIISYRVSNNRLLDGKVFAEIPVGIPDGIKVDEKGNVWSSSKEGVRIYSSEGLMLGRILIPSENTGNLALCTDASKHKWLYVTAANLVLRLPVLVNGGSPTQNFAVSR
ncbi:SMP-30/gluconolactonase/LRE family protein [Erwinia tracheiphila]|uniref:SMP-30/gluconolactonase/LRE family protein n=1 Tax=Erwinia tracheiphila TaxID=65700 RepID=UPI00033D2F9B|nr:SMP-30/gluconolactonase/LRE family protein [Erwinia tracheiphila]EOS96870.1 gluconolactonase [Erwinia tracheiphila PSU-1]UIA86358.1 SMP-30/gluconolactonase/LRE family protein [Erwinia tracheiphila]UIA94678.1 SMP-30/gluconolactonase/LRE family protein [Erwinia tracheiphila]